MAPQPRKSPSRANAGIQRTLGQLEGTLESLVASFGEMSAESARARGKMYDAIAVVKETVTKMDGRLSELEKQVSLITPETKEFTRWRMQAQGAGKLGKALWITGGAILSMAAGAVAAWQWLIGKTPG
jgi:hypothetical protein